MREVQDRPEVIIRRTAAIGDALAASVVADKLAERGFGVTFQTHPNNWCVLRRQKSVAKLGVPEGAVHVDLDRCYEDDPNRQNRHFSDMFIEKANYWLQGRGVHLGQARNCKPKMFVPENERAGYRAGLERYPRPWTFICPRSNSYAVRMVPNHIWAEFARRVNGTCFWLGTTPAPQPIIDLGIRHLDTVIAYLAVADVLVSVDTGPLHIGAALGVPIVAVGQSSSPDLHLSDKCDFVTVTPPLDCLNCQQNICPKGNQYLPPCSNIDPVILAAWANARAGSIFSQTISAVIAVYRPDIGPLNRCLEAILPQVDEVVVCRDQAGSFPAGARKDPKIRYLTKQAHDIGYGRKANYGVRNSNGRYVLLLNDDVYAAPDMVKKLREAMTEQVAIAAPLLRFNDNRIQHAGMVRAGDGGIGFGHIDYGKYVPTFQDQREVECVTGAAVLLDRKAFYSVDGFDERFYLYCEDTALMMSVRQAGYKIMYVPAATGTHDEHLSTSKTPNIISIMNQSNALFGSIWKRYFEHNRGNSGLGNFNYLTV